MLRLTSFSLSTTSTTLLDSVDAVLVEGERVGLCGKNGCGKSTLLKVLSKKEERNEGDDRYWAITSGKVDGSLSLSELPPGSVLLVSQDILVWSDLFPDVGSEQELHELSLPDVLDLALAEGGYCELEEKEAWRRLSVAAEKTLHWNLAHYEDIPLGRLSPGSAVRAFLAVALHRPCIHLLLLDEPTNHLDLQSILWLQQSILASRKTVIVVSHDEAFLDAVADRVWEIDDNSRSLTVSTAQYSAYMHAKRQVLEQQRRAYDEQQKRHERLTSTAEELRLASKAGERYQARDHDLMQRGFFRDRAGRSGKRAVNYEIRSRRSSECRSTYLCTSA